ncbi:aprataxin [Aplysia californica]|uniref:Aprataxin n=1 Tax=Aplysia californica TaxID=6500 RepID=A0ABM1A9Q6_APLCA|nr:aprataxin [Aplysia californica]
MAACVVKTSCFPGLHLQKKNVIHFLCCAMASASGTAGHWSKGLLASMNDPEAVIDADEDLVTIKDKYPKAKFHFLILPRRKIPNLKSLTREDLDLLEKMHQKGEKIANRANEELQFRFGYHAVPSMSHLHMHVISQDFNSPCLKTKKHWNSFVTDYFVDSKAVIKSIQKHGQWNVNKEEMDQLLKQDLKCHICKKMFRTIPELKAHIVFHDVTKPKTR